jgi:ADP-glucose pyrophosphorylase
MLEEGRFDVHVFRFDGYWADVGEPKALYETCRSIFLNRNPDIFGDRGKPIGSVGDLNFYSSKGTAYFTSGQFFLNNSSINGSIFSPGVEVKNSEILDSILLGQSQKNYMSINKSTIKNAIIDKMCNINGAEVVSENGLIIVARGTMISSDVKIHAQGNAVIAPFSELISKINRLKKYIQATGAKLYDNFGTHYEFDELVERSAKQRKT